MGRGGTIWVGGGVGKGLDGLLAIEKGKCEEMGLAAIDGLLTGLRRGFTEPGEVGKGRNRKKNLQNGH